VNLYDPKPWDEALAFGLEAQEAVFRYLSKAFPDQRVWKADEVEGRGVYRDSHGDPIPDLIKMEAGHGTKLVEVKAREEWWQEGGTRGPFETTLEVAHIEEYARVAHRYSTPVEMVFVIRPSPKGTKRGYAARGPAGCWVCSIEELVPLIETGANRPLPKRGRGLVDGRGVLRIQDGGPLRPFAPWNEAIKGVPRCPKAWSAWREREGAHALTHQSGPQFGSPSH
jgi:hypothetical protein